MIYRPRALFVLLYLLGTLALLLPACKPRPSILGRWRTESSARLLFEYRPDGTVFLLEEDAGYQVFRYKITGENALELFDGMGRIRKYKFQLSGDTLVFYDDRPSEEPAASFTRDR